MRQALVHPEVQVSAPCIVEMKVAHLSVIGADGLMTVVGDVEDGVQVAQQTANFTLRTSNQSGERRCQTKQKRGS
jgi:hypothetical protein